MQLNYILQIKIIISRSATTSWNTFVCSAVCSQEKSKPRKLYTAENQSRKPKFRSCFLVKIRLVFSPGDLRKIWREKNTIASSSVCFTLDWAHRWPSTQLLALEWSGYLHHKILGGVTQLVSHVILAFIAHQTGNTQWLGPQLLRYCFI